MTNLDSQIRRLTDRRTFLRCGALGAAGLSLPQLLRAEAAANSPAASGRPKSLIYVVLSGVNLALGGIIVGLGKAAITRHDAQATTA